MYNIWIFLKNKMQGYGDKTAIIYKDKKVSYKELIETVESEALNCEDTIIFSDNLDKYINAVKILQAFANRKIAVPLNPEYGEVYCNTIHTEIESKKCVQIDPDVALIMFTSGSSGRPKGVMLSHKNIISNILAIEKYFNINKRDSILIARPLMHAAVLTGEFLVSLYRGLTIHFYSESFIPQRLISYIKSHEITTFCATPTLLKLICKIIKNTDKLPLRNIAISGECLPPETAKLIAETFSNSKIYSIYGLTEASPRVACLPPEKFNLKLGWVGSPIYGVDMKIIGKNGTEIIGEGEGRLFVKSPGIMRGYFGAPALTENKIKDGWLDTGDIAKRDIDGDYCILGRADNMIIRSGMNIYPEEVENALKSDTRIKNIVCFSKSDFLCGQAVCIAVEGEINERDIAEIAKVKLPAFMQLNKIYIVEDFPLTASGKIDRNAVKNKYYG